MISLQSSQASKKQCSRSSSQPKCCVFPCDYTKFSYSTYRCTITFFCFLHAPLESHLPLSAQSIAFLLPAWSGCWQDSVSLGFRPTDQLYIQQGVVFFLFKCLEQKNSQTNVDSNFKTLCGLHLVHCLPLGRLQFLNWKGKLEGRKEETESMFIERYQY